MKTLRKPKVAFICVHNSCRSQIAEALGEYLANDVFESYSAGTETKPRINQDAVRLMKEIYGIDMEQTQYSKLLDELPKMDIVVKMGCEVGCPFLPGQHVEDWGLDDPTGKSDNVFRQTIQTIHDKILTLMNLAGTFIGGSGYADCLNQETCRCCRCCIGSGHFRGRSAVFMDRQLDKHL